MGYVYSKVVCSQNQQNWRGIKIFLLIIFPALVYLFINYLFVVVVENPGVIVLNPIFSLVIVLYYSVGSFFTGIVISLFIQAFFPDFSKEINIDFWKIENKSQKFLSSFLLIPVLSSYITFFGHRVYPLIPEQFGGGQPKIVQLLFKSDETSEIRQALTKESTSLPTLALLFEEEKYYLIGLYTKKTTKGLIEGETKDKKVLENIIQINRDLVTGIRLNKSRIRYSLSYVLDILNCIFFRSNS